MNNLHGYKIGDKLYVPTHKQAFTVKACNERYAICTKPFNLQKTVIYFIIDFQENWRAPDWWIFGKYDYAVQEDIDECLRELTSGECELSRRRGIPLDILEAK